MNHTHMFNREEVIYSGCKKPYMIIMRCSYCSEYIIIGASEKIAVHDYQKMVSKKHDQPPVLKCSLCGREKLVLQQKAYSKKKKHRILYIAITILIIAILLFCICLLKQKATSKLITPETLCTSYYPVSRETPSTLKNDATTEISVQTETDAATDISLTDVCSMRETIIYEYTTVSENTTIYQSLYNPDSTKNTSFTENSEANTSKLIYSETNHDEQIPSISAYTAHTDTLSMETDYDAVYTLPFPEKPYTAENNDIVDNDYSDASEGNIETDKDNSMPGINTPEEGRIYLGSEIYTFLSENICIRVVVSVLESYVCDGNSKEYSWPSSDSYICERKAGEYIFYKF